MDRNADIWARNLGSDWSTIETAERPRSRPIAWTIHSAGSCAYHVLIEWKQWTQWTIERVIRTARYRNYASKRPVTPICGGKLAVGAYKGKLLLITWSQVRILHGPPYIQGLKTPAPAHVAVFSVLMENHVLTCAYRMGTVGTMDRSDCLVHARYHIYPFMMPSKPYIGE